MFSHCFPDGCAFASGKVRHFVLPALEIDNAPDRCAGVRSGEVECKEGVVTVFDRDVLERSHRPAAGPS